MKILTVDNQVYDLDFVPEEIDDIRYAVLDYSNKSNIDYLFQPLIFLDIFTSPAALLRIGKYQVKLPIDWSIIICEPEAGEPEIIPLTSINDRGFKAFVFNPLTGFIPEFLEVRIENIYNEVKWYTPKLRQANFLAIPIENKDNPRCCYFIKDTNKVPEILDASELW